MTKSSSLYWQQLLLLLSLAAHIAHTQRCCGLSSWLSLALVVCALVYAPCLVVDKKQTSSQAKKVY